MKIRIGIFFGGNSREREISFAGGRTVYDNLNKEIFEPFPVFVDSFGNFVHLNWEFVYKGSIRDFYPPVSFLKESPNDFQVYAESLGDLNTEAQAQLVNALGSILEPKDLKEKMDFAFLCLHGTNGEDGRIQGLLEYYGIPYSGSGIFSSAMGMNKAIQKDSLSALGFNSPAYLVISRENWKPQTKEDHYKTVTEKIGYPFVVKAANQGSSLGISILSAGDFEGFCAAIDKSFFTQRLRKSDWSSLSSEQKVHRVRSLTDIREGIGTPVSMDGKTLYHPEEVLAELNKAFSEREEVFLEGCDAESQVLIEGFIAGKEFSCIVVQNEGTKPIALPPTEIRKGEELFDYRSKYLPGLSRKITPIDLPVEHIEQIRHACEKLFTDLHFNVYARIDGFIQENGKVFLNDPNTTSGMMPSSFFFHQAAEIGLNPSQFLTYIIRTSLVERIKDFKNLYKLKPLLDTLDNLIEKSQQLAADKVKVAVIFGGYSSERHISVESGRNIYEKLSSSAKYFPLPVFLTGDNDKHQLYQIPINLLLKDNADDIREKIENYKVHPVISEIIEECRSITGKYASANNLRKPLALTYQELSEQVDAVFIALHGRPGEDGQVQSHLDKLGVPYNGSGVYSSNITINKYETNEILLKNGLSVAKHCIVEKAQWLEQPDSFFSSIEKDFTYPFITKPIDDGCSSAVKKIKNRTELEAFTHQIFRVGEELEPASAKVLHLKPKEEFPNKTAFLIEELIGSNGAKHFLEITEGLLTRYNSAGEVEYEIFEASEALSEGDVLSLEEKFLAGQGQNITPARYDADPMENQRIAGIVKKELEKAARLLKVEGYARIDAFVRIYDNKQVEVIFIEVNSLPGMTPATCIFHQTAINGYKPYDFIDGILDFGFKRRDRTYKNQPA